jgi:hypothetical protein
VISKSSGRGLTRCEEEAIRSFGDKARSLREKISQHLAALEEARTSTRKEPQEGK